MMKPLESDRDIDESNRLMDDEGLQANEKHSKLKGRSTAWRLVLRIVLVIAAIFGLYSFLRDTWIWAQQRSSTRISCNCGESIAEATSLQCKFDPIASAWLPPHCRDDELIDQFNAAGPAPDGSWNYYTDPNKTATYTYEEVAALGDQNKVFWATLRWHIIHCSYNWRKQFRQRDTGVQLERRFDTIGHLAHCEMMFQKGGDLEEVITHAPVALHADDGPLGR